LLGAGTDAKVFIQMYGLHGKTEEVVLKSKSDTFERKAVRIKKKCLILKMIDFLRLINSK
jgi:hypothetical protein